MQSHEIDKLLSQDESDVLEFKQTFYWNIKEKKWDMTMQKEVVEKLSSLLNSKGGTLIIGVEDDDKSVNGIEKDLEYYKTWDKFQQALISKIEQYIGIEFGKYVKIYQYEKEQKTLCVIKVEMSPRPVLFDKKLLCVRIGNRIKRFSDNQAGDYIFDHWTRQKEIVTEDKAYQNVIKELIENLFIFC